MRTCGAATCRRLPSIERLRHLRTVQRAARVAAELDEAKTLDDEHAAGLKDARAAARGVGCSASDVDEMTMAGCVAGRIGEQAP